VFTSFVTDERTDVRTNEQVDREHDASACQSGLAKTQKATNRRDQFAASTDVHTVNLSAPFITTPHRRFVTTATTHNRPTAAVASSDKDCNKRTFTE